MVNISLSSPLEGDYTSRAAELARQKKLADMLIEMSQQEMPVSTAGGITAPVSPYGALAKALTSFGGAYLSGKAERDAAALDKASRAEALDARSALYEKPGETATLPGQEFNLKGVQPDYTPNVNSEFPEAAPKQNPLIAALKMGDINYNLPATPRSYEEQNRMLDEYELSGNPYMARMATGARARIEAERERDQPKMVAAGANGMIDSNPNSPTYGQRFAVPAADADETTDITNYKFAVLGGEKRPFPVWLAAQSEGKRPTTNVNVGPTGVNYGEPGEGLVWQRGPNNSIVLDARGAPIAIPFQGGKAYVEKETTEASSREAASNASTASSIVRSDIANARSIMKKSEMPVTGIIGSATKGIPGTQSRVLSGLLTTIKANVGFDKLQKMRAASPTGAALGPVSDFENKLLQAVVGDLEQSTTDDQLDRNLKRLDEEIYKIVDNNGKPVGKPGAAPSTSSGTTRRGRYDPATGKVVY